MTQALKLYESAAPEKPKVLWDNVAAILACEIVLLGHAEATVALLEKIGHDLTPPAGTDHLAAAETIRRQQRVGARVQLEITRHMGATIMEREVA